MFTPKLFSISPSEKVIFSSGNLQYNLYDGAWRFASSQLECIGLTNSSQNGESGWVDLFGWASALRPFVRSKIKKDYDTVFHDWGINLPLVEDNYWFTLSNEELVYLLEKRENAIDKCALAEIEGTIGMMILPDEYHIPINIPFRSRIIDDEEDDDYEGTLQYYIHYLNCYSLSDWIILENLGAVFLPFAGQRYGDLVRYVNESGWYWTSNHCPNASGENKGGLLLIRKDGSYDIDAYFAPYGCSVRLVKNICTKKTTN